MALSLFMRSASTKLTGCSALVLSQPALRLSSCALQNASRLPLRILAPSSLASPRLPTITFKTDYSSAAAVKAEGSSSNTQLWIAERVVSAALVALVPVAIAFPCKPLDVLMAVTLVAHTYWGFEAIISEYVRVLLFGSLVPKLVHALLIALMAATLGGLFYLIFDDVGFAGAIRRLWAIKPKQTN